jgi:hypothetical protein
MPQLTKHTSTPEEKELEHKLRLLAILEAQLVQRELDLNTLQASLTSFERTYFRIVGSKLVKYDELLARIAELVQLLNPQDVAARRRASDARAQAADSAQSFSDTQTAHESNEAFHADESLKTLYRKAARKMHPDLATSDSDRTKRTEFMAAANGAYRDGNVTLLGELLTSWEQSPDNVQGDSIGSQLIRAIRQISQIEARLDKVETEIEELEHTELCVLFRKTEDATDAGIDLLAAMAETLDEQIRVKRGELDSILDEFVRRKREL